MNSRRPASSYTLNLPREPWRLSRSRGALFGLFAASIAGAASAPLFTVHKPPPASSERESPASAPVPDALAVAVQETGGPAAGSAAELEEAVATLQAEPMPSPVAEGQTVAPVVNCAALAPAPARRASSFKPRPVAAWLPDPESYVARNSKAERGPSLPATAPQAGPINAGAHEVLVQAEQAAAGESEQLAGKQEERLQPIATGRIAGNPVPAEALPSDQVAVVEPDSPPVLNHTAGAEQAADAQMEALVQQQAARPALVQQPLAQETAMQGVLVQEPPVQEGAVREALVNEPLQQETEAQVAWVHEPVAKQPLSEVALIPVLLAQEAAFGQHSVHADAVSPQATAGTEDEPVPVRALTDGAFEPSAQTDDNAVVTVVVASTGQTARVDRAAEEAFVMLDTVQPEPAARIEPGMPVEEEVVIVAHGGPSIAPEPLSAAQPRVDVVVVSAASDQVAPTVSLEAELRGLSLAMSTSLKRSAELPKWAVMGEGKKLRLSH